MNDVKTQVEEKLSQDSAQDAIMVSEDTLVTLLEAEIDKVTGASHISDHWSSVNV